MRRHTCVLAVVLAVLAAACGGHATTESAAPTTTAAASGGTTGGSAAAAAGDFGSLKGVCGPGDAKGATDQGVTDTSIDVGTFADPTNTLRPGLLQELFDAGTAFTAWCNEAGGINGRKITLTKHDTHLLEGQQRMVEACATDFMEVGGGSALDGGLVDTRVNCKLPQIPGFVNDPKAQAAPLQAEAQTQYAEYLGITHFQRIKAMYPDAIKHFGFLLAPITSSGRPFNERLKDALTPLGYNFVYDAATPAPPTPVDNWRPYVEAMRDAGVEVFEYRGEPENMGQLERAMADVGYYPKVIILEANNYDEKLINGNDAIKDTWILNADYPFENAKDNPPTQQFLDIMQKEIPGWKPAALAVNSFSAWLLFAVSAKACGSNLTRDCVLKNALAQHDWTGGGLHATNNADPTQPPTTGCGVLMQATPQGFSIDTQLTDANTSIYNCSPDNFAHVAP
jgi:ABC-type branched-subunit amino acid transport system substrate-binding protein